ncbi:hypothetical protein PWYN_07930 [Paenibacillus wynnii]|uniref:Uncharacterized protein n=1 Tax=Paenibacillus wynnii TaxID=268407 RepID=A0A098MB63_9BACL|nr:hypothetical protein PWYN_07930 [Paenibacillus wynnii]
MRGLDWGELHGGDDDSELVRHYEKVLDFRSLLWMDSFNLYRLRGWNQSIKANANASTVPKFLFVPQYPGHIPPNIAVQNHKTPHF